MYDVPLLITDFLMSNVLLHYSLNHLMRIEIFYIKNFFLMENGSELHYH